MGVNAGIKLWLECLRTTARLEAIHYCSAALDKERCNGWQIHGLLEPRGIHAEACRAVVEHQRRKFALSGRLVDTHL